MSRATSEPLSMFQSTPPARGATIRIIISVLDLRVSIHAPRAGGDNSPTMRLQQLWVSIHAPRAGGDHWPCSPRSPGPVSIHAPRAGGDLF